MELFYINSDKGKVITLIGAIFTLIFITIIAIFYLISLYFEPIKIFLESCRFILFKRKFNYLGFAVFILILYFYEVIDSFIDGLIMVILKIIIVFILFFIILQRGAFVVLFQFIFLEINFSVNLTLFLLIILFGYFWILVWEIIIIFFKNFPEKETPHSEIKTKILKSKWIDFDKDLIIGESDETLLNKWIDVELYSRKSIKNYIFSTSIIIVTGFVYGIINFFIYDIPAEGNYLNNFVLGSFFPFWSILFMAFLSIRHYIRAIIYCSFMIILELYMFSIELITVEGVFFIKYIIIFSKYLSIDLLPFFNSLSTSQLLNLILSYIGILFIIEFILLIINILISLFHQKGKKIQLISSTKYLYIRQDETYNSWKMLFDLFNIILWPFNPYNWESLVKKIRYGREGRKESLFYNYGRLSYDKALKSIKKYKPNWILFILKINIFVIIGIFTMKYYIGYIIFAGAIIETLRFARSLKKMRIKIGYRQKFADGSIFMKESSDILIIYGIPRDIAESINLKQIK
ncbi:MAG: hypothetical protein ACFFDH_12320 [Promethearchaeota archaeon]